MAYIDQSKLTPAQQASLFEMLKAAGQQPTSGGIPVQGGQPMQGPQQAAFMQQLQQQMPQQPMPQQQMPQAPMMQPQPGDKMDPNEAMKLIMSKATGYQLGQNKQGQTTRRMGYKNPLWNALGIHKNEVMQEGNFLEPLIAAVGEENAGKFLPAGLQRTADGKPFVPEDIYARAVSMAAGTKKESKNALLGAGEWGEEYLKEKGTPGQLAAWRKMSPETQAEFAKIIPSFGTQRSEYFMDKGTTADGRSVQMDVSKNQWYIDGKPVDASEVGRTVPRLRPQLQSGQASEIASLLDARTQLARINDIFDPSITGPIENKLYQFSQATGIDLGVLQGVTTLTDSKVKLNTVMSSAINDYIKAITGAQMSEIEARRIMNALPKPGSADEAFLPALQEIQKITDMKLGNRIKVLKSQGTIGTEMLEGEADSAITTQTPKNSGKPAAKQTVLDAGVSQYMQKNKIRDTPANREWARKKLGI
jgi:hypothetical protein